MGATNVPHWLESLLSADFFSICTTHKDSPRSECNMYCIDCKSSAICFYCRSSQHQGHHVIQIRRSSYHDVVRVDEIQEVLDISGVQTYVINSARVLFLNERPQPKAGKGVSYVCEICGRSLLDLFRFCSLGCKLVGIKKNGDGTFMLNTNVQASERREGLPRRMPQKEEEESHEGSCTIPSIHSNSRRRKGIPRRAPLGS